MSEELSNELAKAAIRWRVKWLGFGRNSSPFTGNAAGVTQDTVIHYNGPGIYVVYGVTMRPFTEATQATLGNSSESWQWSILDQQRSAIIGPQSNFAPSINAVYDNLDAGVVLTSREYLIFSVTSFNAANRRFVGTLWGIEFLFDDAGIDAYLKAPAIG